MNKVQKTFGGYTIIEILLVTAISGMIAISAFSIINGQQEKNEMRQGVLGFQNKVNDIANDVSTGYFPNENHYPKCGVSGSNISFSGFGTVGDGASSACVFGGKILRFNISGSANDDIFDVFTLAARRANSDGEPYTSLDQLSSGQLRIAMASGSDLVNEQTNIDYNLKIKSARFFSSGSYGPNVYGVVFLSGFGKYNQGGSSSTLTGTPTTDIYYFDSVSAITNINGVASNPNNYKTLNSSQSIALCLEQGSGGPTAEVVIGQNGRNLSINSDLAKSC